MFKLHNQGSTTTKSSSGLPKYYKFPKVIPIQKLRKKGLFFFLFNLGTNLTKIINLKFLKSKYN